MEELEKEYGPRMKLVIKRLEQMEKEVPSLRSENYVGDSESEKL